MPSFDFENRSIDDVRPIRVLIIGAGPCGIISAIRLRQRIKNLSIQIFEKNDEFGGTWHQHRYPGVGCDIPALSYQLTFDPNREWTSMYPCGKEIGDYWKRVAKKYRLYDIAKFCHEVIHAQWDDKTGKWKMMVKDLVTGTSFDDEADFVFNCIGQFNNWKWPDIPNRQEYKGMIMHSAAWNETFDFGEKKVALIGSGSSAVQILPKLQSIVGHLDAYIRNQMWLSPRFGADYTLQNHPELGERNFVLTDDLRKRFSSDSEYYDRYRKGMETGMNSLHGFTLLDHPLQAAFREFMTKDMKEKLANYPHLFSKLLPTFPAGCRRVTPDVGFLEALVRDNVTYIDQNIRRFTPTGLETFDGTIHDYDAIVCATGYNSFVPSFPFVGRDLADLREKFKNTPTTYLSVAVENFPNMFLITGPNSEVGTGHSMIVFEKVADYAVKCVAKAQFEQIKAMCPSHQAVVHWTNHLSSYFSDHRTVYGEPCRSAYRDGKTKGSNTALWPGSVLHLIRALQEPRWQDFEYQYLNENLFAYLGDGWTDLEKKAGGDTAYYLDEIDVPPIPQSASVNAG